MNINKNLIKGKVILVTGGTGSFGKMLVSKLLEAEPEQVIIFSRDEDKQGLMRLEYPKNSKLRFVLGDVRDERSVANVVRGVDIIFHAAALKWITEVEYNVWEAVKTNICGIQNIIEAAKNAGVEKVVALSTDKAVTPINAYGMSKALQERLVTTANLYKDGTKTVFISTRYGNVLGSRGSVVPHFDKLIKEGKPLTITDPQMTRFIMTLEESVELVLKALEEGVGGEVFVKKMPAHTIQDLAEVMLEANGLSVSKTVNIGVRPGEKIHETLVGMAESVRTVEMDDYYIILPQINIEAVSKKYAKLKKTKPFEYSSSNTRLLSKKQLHDILLAQNWIKK